ncbi:MAG: hypothetical protein QOI38_1544 [Sphingomonadales bacterium]|nr:hypothetical protein [Sphingomonadales bacterium]
MFLKLAAALQIAAQPAPPAAPAAIFYLPVAGGDYHALEPAERLIRDLAAEPGPRLRRADLARDGYRDCLERYDYIDHAETCIRPLVPRHHRGAPLVVVFVEEVRRPNITGSVVNKTLTVRCVGARAVARAELGGTLDSEFAVRQAREPVRRCLADAARTPEQATVDPTTGAATWRFPLQPGGLTRNPAEARGNALERAIVEIEESRAPGAPYSDCTLSARVSRVVGGWWLRAGDIIDLAVPCGTNGVRHDRPALLYVNFERQLRYLEEL